VSSSPPSPADQLTPALTTAIRAALDGFPHLVVDAEQLARRLAPALSARLGAAAATSSLDLPELARALAGPPAAPPQDRGAVETRILKALERHPSGRTPGVTPESLAALTGIPAGRLGTAVSALVQAGDLVRDAWLVRLPQPDDLLPPTRPATGDTVAEMRHVAERRAIGDRRALGERRLYDRRAPE
jgi:hypothetical protein